MEFVHVDTFSFTFAVRQDYESRNTTKPFTGTDGWGRTVAVGPDRRRGLRRKPAAAHLFSL